MEVTYRISTRRVPNRGTLPGYREEIEPLPGVITSKAQMKRMSEVVLERISWLWYPYIPFGKLTILSGDPGMGKSFISHALAAALSMGEPLPGQEGRTIEPRNVLLLAGEDDPGDTIKPRLISLNAEMERIFIYDGDLRFDDMGVRLVREMMGDSQAKLFIIDPIVAFLGAKMDMNRSNEVRPVMKSIARIAHEFSAAGLIVRHLRKSPAGSSAGKALYSGMGSIDFTAAVRSELATSEGKDGTKYINHIKHNVGPEGKSIIYDITDDEFHWGGQIEPIRMVGASRVSRKYASEDRAREFLFDLLKQKPDGALSGDVYLAAKAAGIGERALRNARAAIAIVSKHGSAGWVWKLNPNAAPISADDLPVMDHNHG